MVDFPLSCEIFRGFKGNWERKTKVQTSSLLSEKWLAIWMGVSYSRGPSVLTPRFLLCLDMSGGNSKNIHNYSGQVSLQKLEPYKLNLGNKSQKISPRPQVPNIHVVNGKGSKALQVRWFVGSRASKLLMGVQTSILKYMASSVNPGVSNYQY